MRKTSQKTRDRRLCFGSRISRQNLPDVSKPLNNPGPGEYSIITSLIKKYPNKTGYTQLASKTPRDKDYTNDTYLVPPIGTYDVDKPRIWKPPAKPFGVGEQRNKLSNSTVPGPGTYKTFKRQVRVCTSFGRERIIIPLAIISCSPFNLAYCSECEQTPIGDYWHKKSTNQDMCRPCMEKELAQLKTCGTKAAVKYRRINELSMYILMRYCGFFHEHNCTKAAVQKMATKDLITKTRKEIYLSSFGM